MLFVCVFGTQRATLNMSQPLESQACSACLSRGRNLVPVRMLRFELQNVLNSIFFDLNFDMVDNLLCWECQAILSKCEKFRKQVFEAQNLMISMNGLSTLSVHKKDAYDIIWTYDDIKIEDDDKHSIKLEDDNGNPDKRIPSDVEEIPDMEDKLDQDDDSDYVEMKAPAKPKVKVKKSTKKSIKKSTKATKTTKYNKNISIENGSKMDERFSVTTISLEQVYKFREEDKKRARYVGSRFKCTHCIKGFYFEDKFKRHNDTWHSEEIGSHVCPICRIHFATASTLNTHYETHLKLYQCRQCSFKHYKSSNIVAHYYAVHKSEFSCKLCCEDFISLNKLRYHNYKFHSTGTKCNICDKVLSTAGTLKGHMLMHSGGTRPSVECPQCGKKLAPNSVKSHMRTHQDLATEKAYCVECGIQFKSEFIYRRHLMQSKRHMQENLKYVCDHCNGTFVNKYTLANHIRAIHMKSHPFRCHLCCKTYMRKDRLQEHIQIKHEGIPKPRDKLCSYCGRGFSDRVMLKSHILTHTGERPFKCEFCPWSFRQKSALTTHIRGKHSKLPKREML